MIMKASAFSDAVEPAPQWKQTVVDPTDPNGEKLVMARWASLEDAERATGSRASDSEVQAYVARE